MTYYTVLKFHWKPDEFINLPRNQRAFVAAAIQLKLEKEKEAEKKSKVKKPRVRKR